MADASYYRLHCPGLWRDHAQRVDRHATNARFDVGPDATQEEIKQANAAKLMAGFAGSMEECLTGAEARAKLGGFAMPPLSEQIRGTYMKSIALACTKMPEDATDTQLRSRWRLLYPAVTAGLPGPGLF